MTLRSLDTGKTKFNISRSHVWHCIRQTVMRPSFTPAALPSVKFTDDTGTAEGGWATPRAIPTGDGPSGKQ